VYRGRATFREPSAVSASKRAVVSREAQKRQTIAERKAAELEATKPVNRKSAASAERSEAPNSIANPAPKDTSSAKTSSTKTDGKDS